MAVRVGPTQIGGRREMSCFKACAPPENIRLKRKVVHLFVVERRGEAAGLSMDPPPSCASVPMIALKVSWGLQAAQMGMQGRSL
ncbi:MAG: hypothetical protein ACPIOQ_12535 [Promethearchaeia archaeon]